jgi:hypothetical protein
MARKNTAREATVEVAALAEPVRGPIGALVKELLNDANLTYAQIVDRVVAVHPEAKTSARSVASTAAALRKGGTEVPKRQPAPTAKTVSEDPTHGA